MNEAFELPAPIGTNYEYILASRHDRLVMVAGQIAKTGDNTLHATGRCGEDVDLETACKNAEIAAEHCEPDERIERILRMTAHIAVGNQPFDISTVADAASRLFISALGEAGRHPRSVIGVSRLPRNAPVLLEVTAVLGPLDRSEMHR